MLIFGDVKASTGSVNLGKRAVVRRTTIKSATFKITDKNTVRLAA